MKMQIYLCVVGSVLLLGFVLTYFRDKTGGTAAMHSRKMELQPFEQLGERYAERTRTGPLAEWDVYESEKAVMADGIDSEGIQVIKCVFDRETGSPLSILRVGWKGVDVSDIPKNYTRDAPAWWLKRILPLEKGQWHWVRNSQSSKNRFLSIWESDDYKASISVHPDTGCIIALRVVERDSSHPSKRIEQFVSAKP